MGVTGACQPVLDWMRPPRSQRLSSLVPSAFRVRLRSKAVLRYCLGLIIQGSKRGRAPNRIWPITWKMSNQEIHFGVFTSTPLSTAEYLFFSSFPKNITARDLSANCLSKVIIVVNFEGVEVAEATQKRKQCPSRGERKI